MTLKMKSSSGEIAGIVGIDGIHGRCTFMRG
jgi:hypothetical protein